MTRVVGSRLSEGGKVTSINTDQVPLASPNSTLHRARQNPINVYAVYNEPCLKWDVFLKPGNGEFQFKPQYRTVRYILRSYVEVHKDQV